MAIHDDNWTKEYAKMEMTNKDRAFHITVGALLLLCMALPVLPHIVLNVVVGVGMAIVIGFAAKFIYSGITGRW